MQANPITNNVPQLNADRVRAVIRFNRRIELPRFTVENGEVWAFMVFGKLQTRLEQIKRGERFDFAGAQVLAQDVEIIYEGRSGLEFCIAAGEITDPQLIETLRNRQKT